MEEYDKSKLKTFWAVERIRLMKTILDKARQNGVAKRMNITLNE